MEVRYHAKSDCGRGLSVLQVCVRIMYAVAI